MNNLSDNTGSKATMPDQYEMDAAWHSDNFHWGPASRHVAAEHLIMNLKAGMPLLRVEFKDVAMPARLLLLVREDERPPYTVHWTWRTWIPYEGYLDIVKRIVFQSHKQTVVFTDGSYPPVVHLRKVSDRVRLLAMFVRWKESLLARQEQRAVALRLCLLQLREHQMLRVLIDRCEA